MKLKFSVDFREILKVSFIGEEVFLFRSFMFGFNFQKNGKFNANQSLFQFNTNKYRIKVFNYRE